MLIHGNAAIITNHVEGVGRYFSRRKIPGGGEHILGFLHLFSVNIQYSLLKGDGFAGQAYHSFEQHHLVAGKTEGDYIKTLGRLVQVAEPPAKMKTTVPDGRFHTHTLDAYWNQDIAKDNKTQ